jgi:protein gp37
VGAITAISWTDHTFNPWRGCTKVSSACDYCYAEGLANRFGFVEWGGERRRTSAANWREPLRWDRAAARDRTRRRVFCASLADVFDNQVPAAWRADLWTLIAETPHLDWLLLTKRPQNIAKMLPSATCETMIAGKAWPWPWVWLGTTVENEEEARRRLPHLTAIPAFRRFVSYEPALGPVDFRPWLLHLDWIIAGGESGPHARAPEAEWFRSVRDQCTTAGVWFHFKQWGGRTPKSGGRLLDGRTWDEVPA